MRNIREKIGRIAPAALFGLSALLILISIWFFLAPGLFSHDDYFDEVVILEAGDLPVMSEADIDETLRMADEIIYKWKKVHVIPREITKMDYYEFFKSRMKYLEDFRMNPVDILDEYNPFFNDKVASYSEEEKRYALRISGPLPPDADARILDMHREALLELKNFENTEGRKLIRGGCDYYSYYYLITMLNLDKYFREPKRILYISNALIIDDAADMSVHTLIRGGLTNGFCCYTISRSAIISYFALIHEDPMFGNDSEEFKRKRNEVLAYIIAHEISHCCFGLLDDYEDEHSLANPTYRFDYLDWIKKKEG